MPGAFVFVQQGCAHCEVFLPKFQHVAQQYRASLPIGIYDLARDGRHANYLATKLNIRATPTLVILDSRGRLHKHEGSMTEAGIRRALEQAL